MYNATSIISRLPSHFRAYDEDSILYKLINAIAKNLEVAEEDINSIMMSRWFATADLVDLENIGVMFGIEHLPSENPDQTRARLFSTIQDLLRGLGTVDSIRRLVEAAVGHEPEIVENPPRAGSSPLRLLRPGEKWAEFCNSVNDSKTTIYIRGLTTTRNPTLTCLTTQETVRYNGLLRKGAVLTILPDGQASLAGIDVSDKIGFSTEAPLRLPTGDSEWCYTDSNALLDSAKFDEAALAEEGAQMVELKMEWRERAPAMFEVRLPTGVGDEQLRHKVVKLVEGVRTAGVVAEVVFGDEVSLGF